MAAWPVERRANPSLEDRQSLIAYKTECLHIELEELREEVKTLTALASQAVAQGKENNAAILELRAALSKHIKRTEVVFKTIEAMSLLRKVVIFLTGSVVGAWALVQSWSSLNNWWNK